MIQRRALTPDLKENLQAPVIAIKNAAPAVEAAGAFALSRQPKQRHSPALQKSAA